tara:strand:+ start:6454 stop:6717 length:264 start_codon:yes stop_codon:yes gene_type:complete
MFKKQDTSKRWKKWKKKAPKVPDHTCPKIDQILDRIEEFQKGDKRFTDYQHKVLVNKIEKIRTANEQLRDSGVYWYDICKKYLKGDK